jgi:hypothetical protein
MRKKMTSGTNHRGFQPRMPLLASLPRVAHVHAIRDSQKPPKLQFPND